MARSTALAPHVWIGPALLGVGLAVLLLGVGLAAVLLGVGLAVLLGVSPGAGAAAGGAGKLVAMTDEIVEWRPPGGLSSLPAIVERQARPGCYDATVGWTVGLRTTRH